MCIMFITSNACLALWNIEATTYSYLLYTIVIHIVSYKHGDNTWLTCKVTVTYVQQITCIFNDWMYTQSPVDSIKPLEGMHSKFTAGWMTSTVYASKIDRLPTDSPLHIPRQHISSKITRIQMDPAPSLLRVNDWQFGIYIICLFTTALKWICLRKD